MLSVLRKFSIVCFVLNGHFKYFYIFCVDCARYETAKERKAKILDIIRTFDLPNNPLDDIIDQVFMK